MEYRIPRVRPAALSNALSARNPNANAEDAWHADPRAATVSLIEGGRASTDFRFGPL